MARHKLAADQRDTLLRIYAAANFTTGPVGYLAKQLAPNIRPSNASRYFDQLEKDGWIVRYVSGENARVFGIELSHRGIIVAEARRLELLPLVSKFHLNDETSGRKCLLPDKLSG